MKKSLSKIFIFSTLCFCPLFATEEPSKEQLEHITRQASSQGYEKDFIDLVEMIYGLGFLSQGGEQSVQNMIGDLDLNDRKVLDIGSGLGGPSLYLAKQYRAHIIALEPQEWMVERAKANLEKIQENLQGSVDFTLMRSTSNLEQFSNDSFDVIFSKEVLLHIPVEAKQNFFSEIFRVLKPGGHIILMDWMRSAIPFSENTKKMIELDGVAYHLITYEEYCQILQKSGFTDFSASDTTRQNYDHSQQNVDTIFALESPIKAIYGFDVFDDSINSWQWQRDAFQSQEFKTAIFRAQKP